LANSTIKHMTESLEKVSLFFSWQSDRKEIRSAIFAELRKVKKQLAQDGIELIVDQDTRERKGTEKIDVALLRKIDDCDIFLADMSPVTTMIQEIDEDVRRTKLIPNPNVMYEYGYATGVKEMQYVLSVASLKKSELAEQLPFDVNHDTITLFNIEEGEKLSLYPMIKRLSEDIIDERRDRIEEYDCEVSWNDNNEAVKTIIIHPKYRRIHYKQRKQVPSPFGGYFKKMEQVDVEIMKPLSYTTDYTYCPVRLIVSNMGEMALDNLFLFLEAPDESIAFAKTNTSGKMAIRGIKRYALRDEQHLVSGIGTLNPNMRNILDEFYMRVPKGTERVLLKWGVQSTCFDKEGYLEVLVEPEYVEEECERDVVTTEEKVEPYVEHR